MVIVVHTTRQPDLEPLGEVISPHGDNPYPGNKEKPHFFIHVLILSVYNMKEESI
jgi:hypothetical protein